MNPSRLPGISATSSRSPISATAPLMVFSTRSKLARIHSRNSGSKSSGNSNSPKFGATGLGRPGMFENVPRIKPWKSARVVASSWLISTKRVANCFGPMSALSCLRALRFTSAQPSASSILAILGSPLMGIFVLKYLHYLEGLILTKKKYLHKGN